MSHLYQLRRSKRQAVPTKRAVEYRNTLTQNNPNFPTTCDVIAVQWEIDGRKIWWPADVLDIESSSTKHKDCERRGKIRYRAYRQYPSELATVVFTAQTSTCSRLISVLSDNTTKLNSCSWIFYIEVSPTLIDSVATASPLEESLYRVRSTHRSGDRSSLSHSPTSPGHSTLKSHRSLQISNVECQVRNISASKTIKKNLEKQASHHLNFSKLFEDNDEIPQQNSLPPFNTDREYEIDSSSPTDKDVIISSLRSRVASLTESLVKARVPDSLTSNVTKLPQYAETVLASLKWLLMKRIEKPLKQVHLPQLSERGIARIILSVKCDCDYATFSDIARSIATYFDLTGALDTTPSPSSSRVCFHPDYSRTQSGSTGVDNLSISFTCLSDVMDFLGVRDEDDYEKILCTEVDTSRQRLLQIVGTLEIGRQGGDARNFTVGGNAARSSFSSCNNVTNTTGMDTISIYVGSAPYRMMVEDKESQSNCDEKRAFKSFMFQQDCIHFCEQQMCYKTGWRTRSEPTSLKIPGRRGLQSDPDRTKYFVLNWSQLKPPSTVKWSRDAQTFGTSFPGRIELSLPAVYTSSRTNVNALSNLLDNCIEEVLRQRISMHTCRLPFNV
ncbi:MAG: hypothetical protein AAGG81_05480 [Chlamydiota bacterium]